MSTKIADVTIRRLSDPDRDAVERLAALDSNEIPRAPLLGAEVEGRLLAAASLADGETVSDPFSPTDEIRALLELRAAQLRRRNAKPRGLRTRVAHPRSRATLAGSPPGAGGRLLSLPR
jgi:hypothetical protein